MPFDIWHKKPHEKAAAKNDPKQNPAFAHEWKDLLINGDVSLKQEAEFDGLDIFVGNHGIWPPRDRQAAAPSWNAPAVPG